MSDQLRRKNHWVPASYLAAFTNDGTSDGLLSVRDRKTPSKCLLLPPRSVAVERDLYVVRGEEEDSKNDEIERILSTDVEAPFIPVRNHIVYGREHGLTGVLSDEDREVLRTFLAFQHIRTPAFREQLQLLEEWIGATYAHTLFADHQRVSAIHQRETGKPLIPEQSKAVLRALEEERILIRPQPKGWLTYAVGQLSALIRIIEKLPWAIFRSPHGVLVPTSDTPVVLVRRKTPDDFVHGGGWAEPNVEATFPLSPTTVLVVGQALRHYSDQGSEHWFRQVRMRISSGARRWLFMRQDDDDLAHSLYSTSAPEMAIEYPGGSYTRGDSAIRAVLDMKRKNAGSALTRYGPREL